MSQRGSALVLAVFLLAILTGLGLALHFQSHGALMMSVSDVRTKRVYYLAEAGVEAGRQALFNTNGDGPFGDDLLTAAGANATIDFDPDAVRAVYDTSGAVTGFSGYGDDVPLIDVTALGGGWYAVFLTNDPANTGGEGSTTDDNDRVMLTGVGAERGGSLEIVQAILDPVPPFPADLPAAITMFGDSPTYSDIDDSAKTYQGDDCAGGGIPGFAVPVAGLIGTPPESDVEGAIGSDTIYTSGGNTGDTTVADLTDPTDPGVTSSSLGLIDGAWVDCEAMRGMVEEVRNVADVICTEGVPCTLPPSAPDRVVFSDGDYTLSATGAGLIWVTGRLTMTGATGWDGIIVVAGEGEYVRSGAGTGVISGAFLIADIAGPDNTYGTSDDCTGGAGGFQPVLFDESAGGTGPTTYCNADVLAATPITKYAVAEFRQR